MGSSPSQAVRRSRQDLNPNQTTQTTLGTEGQVHTRELLVALPPVLWVVRVLQRCWVGYGQQLPAESQVFGPVAVGEQAEVADADKTLREDVQQEAAKEVGGLESHDLFAMAVAVILPAEGDLAVLESQQPVIGKGHFVGVAAQVVEHLGGTTEGRFGINDPLGLAAVLEPLRESGSGGQGLELAVELKFSLIKGLLESGQEQATEESRQDAHRQEEARAAANPTFSIGRQSAAGNHTMQMGMMQQVLPPSVENRQKTDASAQMLGVGGNAEQGLRCGLEQEIVKEPGIL